MYRRIFKLFLLHYYYMYWLKGTGFDNSGPPPLKNRDKWNWTPRFSVYFGKKSENFGEQRHYGPRVGHSR